MSGLSSQQSATKTRGAKNAPKINLDNAINPLLDGMADDFKKPEITKDANETALPANTVSSKRDHEEKDSVIADYLAGNLKDVLCFDDVAGEWYMQKKGLWQVISKKRAQKIISLALSSFFPAGYSISKLNSVEAFLTLHLLLEDGWQTKRGLLPMKNGVFNIYTKTLIDYSHKHRFNWQMDFDFDPKARIDVIRQWLHEATGNDPDVINIIRAFFKMALIGGDVQKFLELIGPGGTGKSTLVRLLVAFIGERNQVTTDLKNLESNRFEVAALYGKRLALINDSTRYGGEVSVLKAITGGDAVRLEKKNQQQGGSFVFDGVVVVASNEAIQTADYTSGLMRRRMPVIFNRKVTDEDKAKWASVGGIETAMKKELPGLLNWVLEMTDDEVKAVIGGINGELTRTQREHLVNTNKIAEWLDDCVVINADAITYIGKSTSEVKDPYDLEMLISEKLYSNYERWSIDSNYHPIALNRFSANVIDVCEQIKIPVEKRKDSKGSYLKGIAIRSGIHNRLPTPVTKTLFYDLDSKESDASRPVNDVSVTYQCLTNDGTDVYDDKNLSVKNNTVNSKDRGQI